MRVVFVWSVGASDRVHDGREIARAPRNLEPSLEGNRQREQDTKKNREVNEEDMNVMSGRTISDDFKRV